MVNASLLRFLFSPLPQVTIVVAQVLKLKSDYRSHLTLEITKIEYVRGPHVILEEGVRSAVGADVGRQGENGQSFELTAVVDDTLTVLTARLES